MFKIPPESIVKSTSLAHVEAAPSCIRLSKSTQQAAPTLFGYTGIGVDNVEIAIVEAYAAHTFDYDSKAPRPDEPPLWPLPVCDLRPIWQESHHRSHDSMVL